MSTVLYNDVVEYDSLYLVLLFFFFNDTATTEIYTLSLHDALPILTQSRRLEERMCNVARRYRGVLVAVLLLFGISDRKSTRLNSSHANISYAVFCLKKKKTNIHISIKYRNRGSRKNLTLY